MGSSVESLTGWSLFWTLAFFENRVKNVVFANEVEQSRPIFN
jgi:hypothetical protein